MVAGGVLFAVLFFFLFASTNILMNAINAATLSVGYFIAFGLVSLIVCYLFVFKNDKYLAYFKEFEGWTKVESRKYGWMSFLFIIAVLILFLVPLIWHI